MAAKANVHPAGAPAEADYSRVLRLFLPYWKQLSVVLALALASAISGLWAPIAMRAIVDEAIPKKDIPMLALYTFIMVASPVSMGALNVWQSYLNNKVGQSVMRDLRYGLFRNLQRQSLAFFTRSRSGEIIQRITGDVQSVQSTLTGTIVSAITQSVTIVATFIILLRLDWGLALVSMVWLPMLIIPTRKVARLRKSLQRETQAVRGEMSAMLAEHFSVSGVLLTRLFGRERGQERRFVDKNEDVLARELRLGLIGRWFGVLTRVTSPVSAAVIYLYGGWSVMHGHMSLGDVVAFVSLVGRLYDPITTLLGLHVDLSASLGVMGRIFEYIDMEPEIKDGPDAQPLKAAKGEIEFRHVSFAYRPGKYALRDVSFRLEAGKMLALVGPSGAGKSTLIHLIARLADVSKGEILIDGRELNRITMESLRGQMAYVTQDPFLFYGTVEDNLRFSKEDATLEEMEEACRKAYIHDYIVSLPDGYQTIVGERGHRLSGGERQRMAIARAILKNPRILILDEATSHLDSQSEAYVQEALERLMERRTTIVIAHRLSTILAADRIVALEAGRIAEEGTHAELLARGGLYAMLYRTQFASDAAGKQPAG
ncbi:ABC transporter ATP-binding protein [Paenibacillus humicola]|uniref:ABC transporter ATP-binding protein n=1 Tax=Paenibacillus humicola TaxID=3110540 RepID=UPI00237BD295|nr:ABC transporter ATP-binding protein [Paenibacillus humicola]